MTVACRYGGKGEDETGQQVSEAGHEAKGSQRP